MHKFKVLQKTLSRTWKSDQEGNRSKQEKTGAEPCAPSGPLAGASNFIMQDSQINVIGGNMISKFLRPCDVWPIPQSAFGMPLEYAYQERETFTLRRYVYGKRQSLPVTLPKYMWSQTRQGAESLLSRIRSLRRLTRKEI
ncbi:hypothetical protein FA15DRAFT_357415 [Coprinopsis marcescibilis]|uniref:Uncharacterized protein n=1 Tax=Coprinopsis marcescibilis TaxID=230819 RepID=A0A5C3KY99_COPMA|nr:hypothetical protein FA15DRAFT_357415 [Coprinopsis marcescibilis]